MPLLKKSFEGIFLKDGKWCYGTIQTDMASGLIDDVREHSPHDSPGTATMKFPKNFAMIASPIDLHVHSRVDASGKELYKEDYYTLLSAAKAGGVSAVMDMPNNIIPPIDLATFLQKFALIPKNAGGSVILYGGIGPSTKPIRSNFKIPYKVYMGPSVGDLYFKNSQELDHALKNYVGEWVSFHCEDPLILEQNRHQKFHHLQRPVAAEVVATQLALELSEKYDLTPKLCHFSAGEGLEWVRKYRKTNRPVYLEASPLHLYFSQEATLGNPYFNINPPLRSEQERLELLQAFLSGEINLLATDHAPHTLEEKENGKSGLPCVEVFLPVFLDLMARFPQNLSQLEKNCLIQPWEYAGQFYEQLQMQDARYGKEHLGGKLQQGYVAHIAVVNRESVTQLKKADIRSKCQHSPFEGVLLRGSIEELYYFGEQVL